MNIKLTYIEEISNLLKALGLSSIYSAPVIKNIMSFLISVVLPGYNGKTTDIEKMTSIKQSTISKFFSNGKWDENIITSALKKVILTKVLSFANEEKRPIFISLDDTVNCKSKPSKKSKRHMKGGSFHYSHLLGKCVWGHQIIGAMIGVGKKVFNYDLHIYDKNELSKIDYAVKLIKELPKGMPLTYILFDSWYSCKKIFNAAREQGYHVISGLKSNRIIKINDIDISASNYGKSLAISEFDIVTVNSKKYYVKRVITNLKGMPKSVILICYREENISERNHVRCFYCSDLELESEAILKYYSNRWKIEVFFKQEKNYFGFSSYQMRSLKSLKRFFILVSLAHFMCLEFSFGSFFLLDGIKYLQSKIKKALFLIIKKYAQNKDDYLDINNINISDNILLLCA